ncbi:hypothetical protein [Aquibacillus salsiterrae]|uniref:Uncharacterized protein n=1 Tax=Aquibacillus salsiterrae TaxID=2950439 RepID=A0A9X3WC25_9BACI|nr:hypothetical protein [Aquibacillus salsiterrae]MDC3417002.1 hypothetical protein [Aquibacillus salsiterrae]
MAKKNNLIGEPEEMSPISEIFGNETDPPVVEVTKPTKLEDPLEIRKPSSVTEI